MPTAGLLALLLAAAPTPTPLVGAVSKPVVAKPRSLADVARENRERAEKGEKKEGTFSIAGGGVVPRPEDFPGSPQPAATKRPTTRVAASSPSGGEAAAGAGASAEVDAYRKRAQRLRDELDEARRAEAAEQARRAQVLTKARNSDEIAKFAEEIQRRENVCRLRVAAAKKELDALPEEARKAGVNPGAVR